MGQFEQIPLSRHAARRARRLRQDSRLLTINGKGFAEGTNPNTILARVLETPGGIVRLGIRQPDGRERTVTLARIRDQEGTKSFAAHSWGSLLLWGAIGYAVESAVAIAAALLLFLRRPGEPVVVFLSLALLLIQTNFGLASFITPLVLGLTGSLIAWTLAGTLLAMGLTQFPAPSLAPRWGRGVCALIAAIGLAGLLLGRRDVGVVVWVAQLVLVAPVLIARYRQLPPSATRQQLRWAFLGFALFLPMIVAGSVIVILSQEVAINSPLRLPASSYGIGVLFILTSPTLAWLGLLVSLLRYRLYDADAAISRSVTYGVLTVGTLAIFAGSEKVIEVLGEEYFGDSLGALAGGLGAGIAAVMLVPLHHRVTHWAEHHFRKPLLRLRRDLPLLVGDLRETAGLKRVAAATLDAVTDGVRSSRAALLVGERLEGARGIDADAIEEWRAEWTPAAHDGLHCDRYDPSFPIRVSLEAEGHGRVGWLLLGPRPDGSLYGKDEREALVEVSDPVARALEIVQLRETREARMEARFAALEDALRLAKRALVNVPLPLSAMRSRRGQVQYARFAVAVRITWGLESPPNVRNGSLPVRSLRAGSGSTD